MPYRHPKKQPGFADLKGILAQSRDTDNALYQTVQILVERLVQFQGIIVEKENGLAEDAEAAAVIIASLTTPTYLTTDNEVADLPNSVRLLAGTNITFDDTVPNQRTISATGGGGSGSGGMGYAPVSTGAEPLEIMSDGAGSVLMVGFSE